MTERSTTPYKEIILVQPQRAGLPARSHVMGAEAVDARLLRTMGMLVPEGLPPVSRLAVETALAAMAEATKAAIAADIECWHAWCVKEGRSPMPADPEDLVHYVNDLDVRGKKPSTLARRVASLGALHRVLGLAQNAAPTEAAIVRAALKAIRRRRGSLQRQAAPLRLGKALDSNAPEGFTLSALLDACGDDLQGLRDAALLSLGYDAGLRVSELTRVEANHIESQEDGSATLFIPFSKTDQEQEGAWAWLSAETVRRVHAWTNAGMIEEGPIFRRVGVDRRRTGRTERQLASAEKTYSIGLTALTRQGVNAIYRRIAIRAYEQGLVTLPSGKLVAAVQALSTHSLRVGLTQDLFAAGEDGLGIAQALRWSSPTTALRYGRKLAVRSNVAARVLSRVRR
ncbi:MULTISPECIES: tyrosine-type recombinase/integrase [unclassified Sphingobium]|uniref:tyrosine-type recombinase/integrase n=1 Tax=unclassified Sphingobium TaxID=2611147 RepID=UPI0005D8C1B3|nr:MULTISPECIES: tyrosine-type recombinase/integrase [unclassified Sphingobium]AJR26854.1 integrase [Sphingobium sp. YBL2]QPI75494.1 tyrosine-type recombinase/integrase [Sphingobium sp. Cam5-1]UZW57888.1 tyrosine-type recombinase/integrase [Sphingobium sp. JS3065]